MSLSLPTPCVDCFLFLTRWVGDLSFVPMSDSRSPQYFITTTRLQQQQTYIRQSANQPSALWASFRFFLLTTFHSLTLSPHPTPALTSYLQKRPGYIFFFVLPRVVSVHRRRFGNHAPYYEVFISSGQTQHHLHLFSLFLFFFALVLPCLNHTHASSSHPHIIATLH